jgi:hypothetical protein
VNGLFTKSRTFAVGPQIVLQAPVLASPSQNQTVSGTAVLTVTNVSRTGPVGQISYQFDVADSSSFDHIVFTANMEEQSNGQTSVEVNTQALSSGTTYYWRVQATDLPSGVASPSSAVFSFQFIAFDMTQATIVDNPPDLGSWKQTATITSVNFTSDAILVEFDRRDGPNRWPDSPFGFPGGYIEYTLGMCLNINSHWFCSAPILFWYGRDLAATGPPSGVGANWFYPPAWGQMAGHQPADGELVGIFAGLGALRHNRTGDGSIYHERTNVALVPFGQSYNAPMSARRALRSNVIRIPRPPAPKR